MHQRGEVGKRITIFSIDRGGVIRDIISSTILEFLEHEFQKIDRPSAALADCFGVVAGTSTRGLLIAMLTVLRDNDKKRPKFSAKQLRERERERPTSVTS